MTFAWSLPANDAEQHSQWLQDESGRFFAIEADGLRHDAGQGDLETFDPRRCGDCGDAAGWLPAAFRYCPLCGGATHPHWGDAGEEVVHSPGFKVEAASPRGQSRRSVSLPRGADFTFALLPRRARVIALDGDSGQVWVWNRPGAEWRTLCSRPTGHHGVPPDRFGILTADAWLTYPTREGMVWIDTAGHTAAVAVSSWRPLGVAAWLGGRAMVPAMDSDGTLRLASRGRDEDDWSLSSPVLAQSSAQGPPPLGDDQWLMRPVVEEDQVHWPGIDGLLHCDASGDAGWHGWSAGFTPVAGRPALESRDGRFWLTGHAPDTSGNLCWAFARIAVRAAPECHTVDGAVFSRGRLCFRLAERYLDTPWNDSAATRAIHRTGSDTFLTPIAELGSGQALLLQLRDQSLMSALLEGDAGPLRGELFLSRAPGQVESLETVLACDGHRWPQAFRLDHELLVYDPVGQQLFAWAMDST